MGSVWGLALCLLFFCWEAGVSGSLAGLRTSRSVPLATTNNTEVPAITQGLRRSSKGAFRTTELAESSVLDHVSLETQTPSTETFSKALIPARTASEGETWETQTIFPSLEAGDTQTTSPAAEIRFAMSTFPVTMSWDNQSTSPAAEIRETVTMSLAGKVLDTQPTSLVAMNWEFQSPSPAAETSKTQTTSPEVGTWETQTMSPAGKTRDTQSTSLVIMTLESQATSPTTETRKTQNISPAIGTWETQTLSPVAETRDTQSISPTAKTGETQTLSSAEETGKIQSNFPVAVTLETQSTSAAETRGIQPTAQAEGSWETQTMFPAAETRKTQSTSPVAMTWETQSALPATETSALTQLPFNFRVVGSTPRETPSTSGSPTKSRMNTSDTGTNSDPMKAIIDTLCAEDSSEETQRITVDLLTLVHVSEEAKSLSSESSSSSSGSVLGLAASQSLAPHIRTLAEALVGYSSTHIELTNCSIREIGTAATLSGTSGTDHSPTGAVASSSSETSALPHSTEAKSHIPKSTASAETRSTARTSESAILDSTLQGYIPSTNGTTKRETMATKAPALSGTLVTVSSNSVEEISALSVETQSHTEVSEALTVSVEAGSTVGEVTSSAVSSASVHSTSEVVTIQNSTPSETFTTGRTVNGSFLISRSPLSPVPQSTANSSQETNITLAKTTTSPNTPGKPPTPTPSTALTRQTPEVTEGGGGRFLLVRLSVSSPEDLTEPRAAERLIQQLHCELHAHLPLVQVSLLNVRRA